MNALWVRFREGGTTGFGTLEGERIRVCEGDMFAGAVPTDRMLALAEVRTAHAGAADQGHRAVEQLPRAGRQARAGRAGRAAVPDQVAQLVPRPGRHHPPSRPAAARWCSKASWASSSARPASRWPRADALDHVLGYTCANDVTVADILNRDASLRAVGARQGLRHLLPLRPGGGHRAGSGALVVRTLAERPGAPGLPDQRHALFGAATGQPDLAGHDAVPGRHHPVRHLRRRRAR